MLRVILALILMQSSATPQNTQSKIQVLVPDQMKINLEIEPDTTDSGGSRYIIKLTGPDDVRRAWVVLIPINRDGKNNFTADSVLRLMIKPNYPGRMSIEGLNITSMLVVVEWIETSSGKWVLDNSDKKVPVESVVKGGLKALPKGTFVEKK